MTRMFATYFRLVVCGVFVLGLLPGMGHTSQIEMNLQGDGSLDVSCRAKDLATEIDRVLLIQILKAKPEDGTRVLYAHIDANRNGLQISSGVRQHLQGWAMIYEKKQVADSYISLTMANAQKTDEGVYVCEVFYRSLLGQMKVSTSKDKWVLSDPPVTTKSPEILLEEALKAIEAKLKTHKAVYDDVVGKTKKLNDDLVAKLDKMRTEGNRRFDEIVRRHYVSKGQLDKSSQDLKNSLEADIQDTATAVNLKIHATKSALEKSLESLEEASMKDGFGRVETLLLNITGHLARKDDLRHIRNTLDSIEDVLEKQSEQVSVLFDKVTVNEFALTSLKKSPAPTTTKAPFKDPVLEVLEKVTSMEQRAYNQTMQIDFLLENDLEAFYDMSGIARANQHIDDALRAMEQKAQDATVNDVNVAFSANFQLPQEVFTRQHVMFDDVTLNQGQGYNQSSSTFTAPLAGVYVFHLTLMTNTTDDFIDVEMRNNRVVMVRLTSQENEHLDQTSASVVTPLQGGDTVEVLVKSTLPTGSYLVGEGASVFAGYKMKSVH